MTDLDRAGHDRPARLRVGVVGVGRVGASVGAALHAAGHRVAAVSGLSERSLERARTMLPGAPVYDVEDVVDRAELLLLTVPEADLPSLVRGLTARRVWPAGQIVVHTSPRHGIDVLEPAVAQHILPIALHPAMRFTGTPIDLHRLTEAGVAVTSSPAMRAVGEALVVEMGAEPVWVAEHHRARYAAAVAHVAGHLAVVVEQAGELLREAEVQEVGRLLEGLLGSGVESALRANAADSAREIVDDLDALRSDLDVLRTSAPDTRAVHLAVARAAAARSMSAGRLANTDVEGLFDLLTDRGAQD